MSVVPLSRFLVNRRYVATSSRFRRVKVVARRTLCHPDEWRHHPTSRCDETTTMVGRDRGQQMNTVGGSLTTIGMVTIGSRVAVTTTWCDAVVMSAQLAMAISDMLIMQSHLISRVNCVNQPAIIADLFRRRISTDSQSDRHHHELTTMPGI